MANAADDALFEDAIKDLIDFDWEHEAFEKDAYIEDFAQEHGLDVDEATIIVESAIDAIATEEVDTVDSDYIPTNT